jgi:hypothetical protein
MMDSVWTILGLSHYKMFQQIVIYSTLDNNDYLVIIICIQLLVYIVMLDAWKDVAAKVSAFNIYLC